MFANLRRGSTVYILDTRETPRCYTATVKDVSQPYFPPVQPGQFGAVPGQQFINIVIDNHDPFGVPMNGDTVSKGGLTVSCTREGVLEEVNAQLNIATQAINSIDRHKANAEAFEQIIRDFDPSFARTQAQEEKITELQAQLSQMQQQMQQQMQRMTEMMMQMTRPAAAPQTAAPASSKTNTKNDNK